MRMASVTHLYRGAPQCCSLSLRQAASPPRERRAILQLCDATGYHSLACYRSGQGIALLRWGSQYLANTSIPTGNESQRNAEYIPAMRRAVVRRKEGEG